MAADSTYLSELAHAIAVGLRRLPQHFCAKQARFVAAAQRPDGGFRGRGHHSDLYYTGFAIRALDALDHRDDRAWRQAAGYVCNRLAAPANIVDCLSLLHAKQILARRGHRAWSEGEDARCIAHSTATLERFAAANRGYSRTPGGSPSLYHTFLAALCRQLMRERPPDPSALVELVTSRQCPDRGFSDLGESARGETNPTAAAVALLQMLGKPDAARDAAEFLVAMQRLDGGLAAHADAPVSDMLSTFTALVALKSLDAAARLDLAAAGRFAQRLAAPEGGFRGALVGDEPDVEYTYYGLGVLGLLSAHVAACTARADP